MRLSISNIAWDVTEDEAIARLLQRFGVDAIDVAPGKYFPDPSKASPDDMARIRRRWAERGIEIVGMQALLFATAGLNLFGAREVQDAMLAHLAAVCRIGAGLGAPRLVFGSPKNRDRSGLDDEAATEIAVAFFRRLGETAQAHGVAICLEPTPTTYGANFMTDSAQTADIVERVAHPAIRLQFDTGALATNGEDAEAVLQRFATLIGHAHASEPGLRPLGDGGCEHAKAAAALRRHLPGHVVCVEMLATQGESHVQSIERALELARRQYGDPA